MYHDSISLPFRPEELKSVKKMLPHFIVPVKCISMKEFDIKFEVYSPGYNYTVIQARMRTIE